MSCQVGTVDCFTCKFWLVSNFILKFGLETPVLMEPIVPCCLPEPGPETATRLYIMRKKKCSPPKKKKKKRKKKERKDKKREKMSY